LAITAAPAHAGYYHPSQPFTANDATQTGADQECDGDDVAIGGGVSGGGDYADAVLLNTSRRGTLGSAGSRTAWTAYVDNYTGGGPSVDSRVYAMCDSTGKPKDYAIRSSPANIEVPDGTQDGGVVKCDRGQAVVGGGAISTGFYADETYVVSNGPADTGDRDKVRDDGWRAVLNNDAGGSTSNSLLVFAVCDKRHNASSFRYVTRTHKVADGTQEAKITSCNDRPVVGGGVESKARYTHGLYINSSFPNSAGERFWTGTVTNYDTPDDRARKVAVTAICKR
jgi:hypothetical protein